MRIFVRVKTIQFLTWYFNTEERHVRSECQSYKLPICCNWFRMFLDASERSNVEKSISICLTTHFKHSLLAPRSLISHTIYFFSFVLSLQLALHARHSRNWFVFRCKFRRQSLMFCFNVWKVYWFFFCCSVQFSVCSHTCRLVPVVVRINNFQSLSHFFRFVCSFTLLF